MLSIIICSRRTDLLKQVSENISQTVGVAHEIVVVDNQANTYNICQAYNLGASQSQFPYLCFSHEDVLFHTPNWGNTVIESLKNEKVGVLGVVGSKLHPQAPAAWWDTGLENIRLRILQHQKNKQIQEEIVNPENLRQEQVVTLDGLWFCCRQEVWKKNKFDELTFTDFHFYDHDFSFQIAQNYENYVSFEILIEHFSLGNLDYRWRNNVMKFYQKWKNKLPLATYPISNENHEKIANRIFTNFTTKLIENQYDKKIVRAYVLPCLWKEPRNRQHHWFAVWLFEQYFPKLYKILRNIYRRKFTTE